MYDDYLKDTLYRVYLTDSVKLMGENKTLNVRYYDLIKQEKNDDRTGDDIALDLINRLGLKVN